MTKKTENGGEKMGFLAVLKLLPKPWILVLGILIGMGLLGGGTQAADLVRGLLGLPPAVVATAPSCCDSIGKDIRRLVRAQSRMSQRLARLEGAMGIEGPLPPVEDGP